MNSGEQVAIIGASGSGKTTLLSLCAGLDTADSGKILLNGNNLTNLNENQRTSLRCNLSSFVFQNFELLDSLNALENVMLPLELKRCKTAKKTATNYLKAVGLAKRLTHYPNQLSGGEQQRVALARAFAPQPAILFADEPTGNLDTSTSKMVTDLMFEISHEQSSALLLATHDMDLARRCNRCLQLKNGELVNY